ncbi:hypothetical protein AAC387_Pa08g1234 [Persea americana]
MSLGNKPTSMRSGYPLRNRIWILCNTWRQDSSMETALDPLPSLMRSQSELPSAKIEPKQSLIPTPIRKGWQNPGCSLFRSGTSNPIENPSLPSSCKPN